jgi:hypothetical protein
MPSSQTEYQKEVFDLDKRTAMRVFLTFFLKKREDIIKKIEDLGSLKL